jgi:hypothetical protein
MPEVGQGLSASSVGQKMAWQPPRSGRPGLPCPQRRQALPPLGGLMHVRTPGQLRVRSNRGMVPSRSGGSPSERNVELEPKLVALRRRGPPRGLTPEPAGAQRRRDQRQSGIVLLCTLREDPNRVGEVL